MNTWGNKNGALMAARRFLKNNESPNRRTKSN